MSRRPVRQIVQPKPAIEGAGGKLQRAFGFGKTNPTSSPRNSSAKIAPGCPETVWTTPTSRIVCKNFPRQFLSD